MVALPNDSVISGLPETSTCSVILTLHHDGIACAVDRVLAVER